MILDRGSRSKSTLGLSTNTALVMRTMDVCTNLNCKAKKRSTHSTSNFYCPSGGKEGQFPPNFGQQARANVASTMQGTTEHFVLSARVPENLGNSGIIIEDDKNKMDTAVAFISKIFQGFNGGKIPTFIDSGTSDTMFMLKGDFSEYKLMTLHSGHSAKAVNGNFNIVGEGSVTKHYLIDGKEKELTYTHVIHTPSLNANLILVSTFNRAGLMITFGGG